jgi:YD repeat-containing protein
MVSKKRNKVSFILSILFCFFVSLSFAGTTAYQYDDLNRLIRAQYPDGKVIEYTYDAAGNRVSKVITGGGFSPGDANGDGSINVQDVICIINVILDTGTASGNPDCNNDGDVNVLDVICVINKILGG